MDFCLNEPFCTCCTEKIFYIMVVQNGFAFESYAEIPADNSPARADNSADIRPPKRIFVTENREKYGKSVGKSVIFAYLLRKLTDTPGQTPLIGSKQQKRCKTGELGGAWCNCVQTNTRRKGTIARPADLFPRQKSPFPPPGAPVQATHPRPQNYVARIVAGVLFTPTSRKIPTYLPPDFLTTRFLLFFLLYSAGGFSNRVDSETRITAKRFAFFHSAFFRGFLISVRGL